MILVAILTVRRAALAEFRRFETQAPRLMAEYGGAIERTIVVGDDGQGAAFKEVHLVTFPDRAAFEAYQKEPRLAALAALRAASVLDTEVLIGEEGPEYPIDDESEGLGPEPSPTGPP